MCNLLSMYHKKMEISRTLHEINRLYDLEDKIIFDLKSQEFKKRKLKYKLNIKIKSNYKNQFLLTSKMYKQIFPEQLQQNEETILHKFNNFLGKKSNFKKYLDNAKYLEDILTDFTNTTNLTLDPDITNKIHQFIIYLTNLDCEEDEEDNIESKWFIYKRNRKQKQQYTQVEITDSTTKAKSTIYLKPNNNLYTIITESGESIGTVTELKDPSIPASFKFNNMSIRNPKNGGLPVYKFIFNPDKRGVYHDLPKSSYQEYRYNHIRNALVSTYEIKFI